MLPYHTQRFEALMPTIDYIARYRDVDRFEGFCKACHGYGHRWGCPPFADDTQPDLAQYSQVKLIVVKIFPDESRVDSRQSQQLINEVRRSLEPDLLAQEVATNGRAALFTGLCPHCPGQKCARSFGQPCRHPELVRPSLEALGFDLCATVQDVFGIKMLWSTDGFIPEYLTIVGGLFF